jgi:hypothetical protein
VSVSGSKWTGKGSPGAAVMRQDGIIALENRFAFYYSETWDGQEYFDRNIFQLVRCNEW